MPVLNESSARSQPLGLVAAGVWTGLIVGAAEASLVWSFRATNARVTLDDLRVNRHAFWMIPAMDAAIFAAIGLVLGLLSIRRPSLVKAIAGPSLAIPAVAAFLFHAYSLHWAARWVLAAGVGIQVGRLAIRWENGFTRIVRWTLPAMAVATLAFGILEYRRVDRFEQATTAARPAPATRSPNVLLLVLDTVRADHLSLYGYDRETTPNLAKLAAGGVLFDSAISPAPWTLPSHASMFTGKWPHELSTRVDRPLDASDPTLAEFLAGKGYATAGFVANTYYCNSAYGLDRGFARYEDFPQNRRVSLYEIARSAMLGRRLLVAFGVRDHAYAGEKSTRKTAASLNRDLLAWIDGDPHRTRPFFGFVNYYDAHGPYQPPKGALRRFGLSTLPEAEREKILRERRRITSRKDNAPLSPADTSMMDQATDLLVDTYDDCLAQLDAELGDLLTRLDERGLRDDTIVIVTSDHGEHFGEHHLFGHGLSLYHAEVHVPLLIFAPGAPRGLRIDRPVSLRDLPATVADLIGSGTASFPGRSLATLFEGSTATDAQVLTHVEHQKKFNPSPNIPASRGAVHGLIDGRWSYVSHADGSEELYDVAADPEQTTDLLKANPEQHAAGIQRFRASLDQIRNPKTSPETRLATPGSEIQIRK